MILFRLWGTTSQSEESTSASTIYLLMVLKSWNYAFLALSECHTEGTLPRILCYTWQACLAWSATTASHWYVLFWFKTVYSIIERTCPSDHCIEQLRQNIQCAGDLTPVPLRPYGDPGKANQIGTPQVHTCRNWITFRKWYSKWGEEHRAVAGGRTWLPTTGGKKT